MRTVRLSKSKIISGLQCSRRLWFEVHRPDLAVYDAAMMSSFAGGHQVGAMARQLYSGGILVESQKNLSQAVRQTQAILAGKRDTVVFEGAFRHRDVLVRADVLVRTSGRCRLVEVKSATRVKPYHIDDAAVQAWVVGGAGVRLEAVAVSHVDTSWVYGGDGDYRGLLREVDVTAEIQPRLQGLPDLVRGFQAMVAGSRPVVTTGRQCSQPFSCPFFAVCSGEEGVVEGGCGEPVEAGVVSLATRRLMAGLPYPRAFLDFETVNPAIPLWAGTRPYEQVPFQWSCHRERYVGAPVEHAEFLAQGDDDPRRAFVESLLALLGDHAGYDAGGEAGENAGDNAGAGPVFVYGSFEASRLRDLAVRFPDLAPPLEALTGRLVDLLPVVRAGYSCLGMKGFSLKVVLPTIAPHLGYDELEQVYDGVSAQQAFLEIIGHGLPNADGQPTDQLSFASDADGQPTDQLSLVSGDESAERRRADLRQALLAYCRRDTLALVELVAYLEGRSSEGRPSQD